MTSSPPHCVHLLGYHLHRRFNLPWVADFRDPWITGGNPNRRHRFRLPWEARWERKVITRAEVVVANAPGAALRLQEAYPPYHHKIKTILNGYDRQNLEGLSAAHRSNGTLEILHTGELYAGRDPRPFLDAIQLLRWNSRPVRVRFLGRTDMGDRRFRAEIQRRGLDSFIDVGEQVPYTQAIQAMIDADILMLLDTPGRRVGIPAKLYEYIGVGRPVLALAERDSDVAWALRESGIPHRVASASDPLQIKQALAELMAAVDDNHAEFSRQEQRSLFTREGMARQLAEIMTAALEEKLSC